MSNTPRPVGYLSGDEEMVIPAVPAGPAPGAVMDEPMWTIQQLAEYLQVPVKSVRRWREIGEGPRGYRVGRHLRFRRADVMVWLEAQG